MERSERHESSTKDLAKYQAPSVSKSEENKAFAVTIGRPVPEVYNFWRQIKNLPLFMKELERVDVISETRSHWVVKGDRGPKIEWDAEIIEDIPDQSIAWRSLEGSSSKTAGRVWFEPTPRDFGTVVTLSMGYEFPGGRLTELAATLIGEKPDYLAHVNLRRLKAYLETGEVPTIDGQPNGKDGDKESDSKLN